jgi:hypothetical protein
MLSEFLKSHLFGHVVVNLDAFLTFDIQIPIHNTSIEFMLHLYVLYECD